MIRFERFDSIYFAKTKEYMQEVISSYSIGNYRSANVMLYSVLICDLLFKLCELRDMYNDTVAMQILNEYEQMKRNPSSKSHWEQNLLDAIREKTQLLDSEDKMNIIHLSDHRNFSAHPALSDDYELITPSKESTAANIDNMIKIFIKPPIFIKKVFDMMTEDLKERTDIFHNDDKGLENYLNNKYYSRMTDKMKSQTLKSLWKICFKLSEDEECISNRSINRRALTVLIDSGSQVSTDTIKSEITYFSVAQDDDCIIQLIILLASFPELYKLMLPETNKIIDLFIDQNVSALFIAWFKFESCKEHIKELRSKRIGNVNKTCISKLVDYYTGIGQGEIVLDFYVDLFGNSTSFINADNNYDLFIEPFIDRLNNRQVVKLLDYADQNYQLSANWNIKNYLKQVLKTTLSLLDDDFDSSKYTNISIDEIIQSFDSLSDSEGFSI